MAKCFFLSCLEFYKALYKKCRNVKIVYVFFRNFRINNEGNIYINGDPDSMGQGTYELIVVAKDSWTPPRQAVAMVTVQFEPITGQIVEGGRSQADLILIVILGVLCGIMLILIILLLVYIYRR